MSVRRAVAGAGARRTGPRALLLSAITLIVAAGCATGPAFSAEDLPSIVLQAADAPDGTEFVAARSGPVAAGDLTSDGEEIARLADDGFVGGFDAIFASPGLAGVEGDISRSSARIADSTAFVFASVSGAASTFARLERDVPDSFAGLGTIFPISVDDLGEEGFGVRVEFLSTTAGPDVAVLYVWRDENLILRLVMWGEALDEETDVRPVVDTMVANTGD